MRPCIAVRSNLCRNGHGRSDVAAHLFSPIREDLAPTWDRIVAERNISSRSSHSTLHRALGGLRRSLVRQLPGVPLHAAACRLPSGQTLLAPGSSRSGKSTLALDLTLGRSASPIADDIVWVTAGVASGIGAPVAVRDGSPWWDQCRVLWYADSGDRLLVRADDLGGPACSYFGTISAVAFPAFDLNEPFCRLIEPAEAFCRLLESSFRPAADAELLEIAQLVAGVPSAALKYRNQAESLEMCDYLLDTRIRKGSPPKLLASGSLAEDGIAPTVSGVRFGEDAVLIHHFSGQVAHIRNFRGRDSLPSSVVAHLSSHGFVV